MKFRNLRQLLAIGGVWLGALTVATSAWGFTPGKDGVGAVTVAGTVVNTYTTLDAPASAGDFAITVGSSAGITVGDLLLVYQAQGAAMTATDTAAFGDYTLGNAGRFEYVNVRAVAGNVITISDACSPGLNFSYDGAATAGAVRAQVIRVPQYSTLTVSGAGSIVAPAWNGSTGGVVAVWVQGAADLGGSGVLVNGRGFRGGSARDVTGDAGTDWSGYRGETGTDGAAKGEGIVGFDAGYAAFNGRYGRGAPANGGGGGNAHNAGGGGGGNGGAFASWNNGQGNPTSAPAYNAAWLLDPSLGCTGTAGAMTCPTRTGGGRGGYSYSGSNGDALTQPPGDCVWAGNCRRERGGLGGRPVPNDPVASASTRLFFGGGGGAGDGNNGGAGSGGAGGGLALVVAGSITGTINAGGAAGTNTVAGGNDAPGGGGAGGTIVALSGTTTATGFTAVGGPGGVQTISGNEAEGPGGGGGGGFIAVSGGALPAAAAVAGGTSGTSNSGAVTEFIRNGATNGGDGQRVTGPAIANYPVCPVTQADLAVTKSNGGTSVVAGGSTTYTIRATNNGPSAVTGAVLHDPAAAGLAKTAVACSATPGQCLAAPSIGQLEFGAFALPALAVGQFYEITVTATVIAGAGSVSNAVSVAPPLGVVDPNPANDSALDTDAVEPRADLVVAKSVSNPTPNVGSTVTFTVTVSNAGPSNATGVVVTDTLPAGYTLVSATPGTGTWTAPTWTVGSLANGASAVLSIVATVNATGPYLNTASATGGQVDPNPGNNSGAAGTTPAAQADLVVTKAVSNATPIIGGTVTFTVQVSNAGPANATGVLVTDVLPAGYTLVSATPSLGTWAAPTWSVGNLANGGSATLSIVATVNGTGPYLNTATGSGNQSDPNPGNNSGSVGTTPQAAFGCSADFYQTRQGTGGTALLRFSPPVLIAGGNADNVYGALLPIGVNGIGLSVVDGYIYGLRTDAGAARLVRLSQTGASDVGTIVTQGAQAPALPASFTPTAGVFDGQGRYYFAGQGGGNLSPAAIYRVDDLATDVSPAAGVQLGVAEVYALSQAVTNLGDFAFGPDGNLYGATGTNVVQLLLTPGTATVTSRAIANVGSIGSAFFNDAGRFFVYDNGAGLLTEVLFTYGPLFGTAPVSIGAPVAITGTPPVPASTSSSDGASCGDFTLTDLAVTKSVDIAAPAVGSTVTFTVTVANNGPSDATGVVVTDALPAGYTLVSATPSVGTWAAPTWTVGSLANGASATLTIAATVNASGPYLNAASATGNETDPNPGNNSDDAGTTPLSQADLVVTKTVSNPTPNVGGTVAFTVQVSNNGPSVATGVVVTDVLPAGYTLVSATPGVGTWTAPTWTVGSLANGASATLTIVATVNATGPYLNTASGTGNETDPNLGNNTGSIGTTPVAQADLVVVKTVDNATPNVGGTVTFSVQVSNAGPSDATGVVVTDALPAGYTLVSATPSVGTWAAPTWTVGTLANGASATLTIVATVNATGPYLNTASGTGNETDPNLGNNTGSIGTTPVAQADLVVLKTVDNATPNVGGTVTFSVQISNAGPSDATGVVVTDALPAGYTLVSATPSVGTWAAPTWTVGTLANGASATLTIVATVNATGPYLNTASGSGNETDPNLGNNTGSIGTTPVAQADLVVSKTVDNATPNVGGPVTFSVQISNAGPSDATGVVVTDALPAGYTLVSATPSVGTWTAPTWTVGNLTNGASATLTIVATVNATGPYLNTANGTGNETDPNLGNNTDDAGTTPVAQADLVVVKTVDNATPNVGGTVTFSVQISNAGPSDATGVVVTDALPAGYTLVSATPSTGTWAAPTWTVGNLANGASATLTMVATVNATGPYLNTASGTGNETDPNLGNNSDDAGTTPITLANVSIAKSVVDGNGNGVAEPGEALTWTITLSNSGGQAATGFGVTDPLDANTSFVSASNGGVHTAGVVTWTGLTVPGNGSTVLTVAVTVVDPVPPGVTRIGNLAYATGNVPPDCTLVPRPGNCASLPTAARLSVTKALSGESLTPDGIAQPGEVLTYTITVRNEGGTSAASTLVNETVPAHTSFAGGAPVWTCAIGAPAGTPCDTLVDVPAFAAGSPGVATATFAVQVANPIPAGVQQIANAVAVNDQPPPDCQATPSSPQCAITPTINLGLAKTVQSLAATGPNTWLVLYQIQVSNLGGSVASYTLSDTLGFTPQGVVFNGLGQVATVAGTLNPALAGGQFTPVNGAPVQVSATAVAIPAGAVHTYTVRIPLAVLAGGVQNGACTGTPGNGLFNQASVVGSFSLGSSACAPIAVNAAAIGLVKTVRLGVDGNGNGYGDVGDLLHYGFVVGNPGSVDLSAIQLLDARVTDLSCDPLTGNGQPITVLRGDEIFVERFELLGLGGLQPGDTITCAATYALTADDVAQRRVVNTATASGSGPEGQVVSATSTAVFTGFR